MASVVDSCLVTHAGQWVHRFSLHDSLCFYGHLKYFIMKNVFDC